MWDRGRRTEVDWRGKENNPRTVCEASETLLWRGQSKFLHDRVLLVLKHPAWIAGCPCAEVGDYGNCRLVECYLLFLGQDHIRPHKLSGSGSPGHVQCGEPAGKQIKEIWTYLSHKAEVRRVITSNLLVVGL
jgi:hypothetical protein